ncbi:MAG: hypothetical protein WC365_04945 [Candidatus Babeliales bacterium]|jgi:hypothetical protein
MNKFNIEIVSVPDRNKLVAEIWNKEDLIAEINQEKDSLEIALYPLQKVTFDFQEFLKALETAKVKLKST